jgi:hypothetical protein
VKDSLLPGKNSTVFKFKVKLHVVPDVRPSTQQPCILRESVQFVFVTRTLPALTITATIGPLSKYRYSLLCSFLLILAVLSLISTQGTKIPDTVRTEIARLVRVPTGPNSPRKLCLMSMLCCLSQSKVRHRMMFSKPRLQHSLPILIPPVTPTPLLAFGARPSAVADPALFIIHYHYLGSLHHPPYFTPFHPFPPPTTGQSYPF